MKIINGIQSRITQAIKATQRVIDDTQLSLASGKQVNSALDNPEAFFTSQALSYRADDLGKLLDGIGQSVRVLQETDSGLSTIIQLLDLAEANIEQGLADSAAIQQVLTPVPDGENDALSFSAATDGIALTGLPLSGTAGSTVTVEFWMEWDGTDNAMPFSFGRYDLWFRSGQFGFNSFNSDIYGISSAGLANTPIHVAAVFTDGNLTANTLYLDGVEQTLTQRLSSPNNGNAQITTDARISGNAGSPTSYSFHGLLDEVRIWDGTRSATDIQDNMNLSLTGPQTDLLASYNFENVTDGVGGVPDDSTNGNDGTLIGITAAGNSVVWDDPPLSALGDANPRLELTAQHLKTLEQIDSITVDANYRGINLLAGDDLEVNFNETRSSTLITKGIDATSEGLGLSKKVFLTDEDLIITIDNIKTARQNLRMYNQSIQSNLSIIKTRENFTRNTINTLKSGADDLVLADQNKKGAEFLALETRQQLQVQTLALSSNFNVASFLF